MLLEGAAPFLGRPFVLGSVAHRALYEQAVKIGERAGTRTQDLAIKSRVLYQLSYALVTMR